MKNKVKVLQVVGQLRIGGAENVAMNLYRYIDKNVFEFHYLVYGEKIGDYEMEVAELGGKVIHIKYNSGNIRRYKRDLLKVIEENGPYDIIHSHMMFHNGIVLHTAKKAGIPVKISHAHSTNDGAFCSGVARKMSRKIYLRYARQLICNDADLLVACGENAGIYLYGKTSYKKRGMLLRNGIDIEKYRFNEHIRNTMRKSNMISNNRVYGCIGHFSEVKNHAFLIEVFDKLSYLEPDAILVLLGDGELRTSIEQLCRKKNLNRKVVFKGNVQNVHEWLQAMDCLLMPSLYEGIPVTLVEAQASGLKCFVSDKISKEINLTGDIKYIPLHIDDWVDIIHENNDYDRQNNTIAKMSDSGYNVVSTVKEMEMKYIEMVRQCANGI